MVAKKKHLRSGFTTGACASAAAKAATLLLLTGKKIQSVEIPFPGGKRYSFTLKQLFRENNQAVASVIKDAGDDPDVTNGAEIIAIAAPGELHPKGEQVEFIAGSGVGTITKPGLPVAVGEPAINPVPRQMIREAVHEVLVTAGHQEPITITISVAHGEQLAEKTLNHRLGIVGGLSILGTTGIVRPVSAAAWTATIQSSMRVARAMGLDEVVLSTGRTSEKTVQDMLQLPVEAFAMMGDYLEFSLLEATKQGFNKIHLAVMWGKVCKAAMEIPQTHVRHGALETEQIVDFLARLNVKKEVIDQLHGSNTAREIYLRLADSGWDKIITLVCERAKQYAEKISKLPVTVYLVTADKKVIRRV